MRAVYLDKNEVLTWGEVPDPVQKKNEVIIEVKSAGVNRADLLQREGKYPSPPGWPDRMGLEVAGLVLKAPEDGRWNVGDKVCALLGGGGYAEQVAVPLDLVLPVPHGLSMEEAASIPEVFTTAYLNLFNEGELKPNETVFVPAGGSGLGVAIIQLAKHFGAKVITTVGSEAKVDFVSALGADVVINRKKESVFKILDHHRIDLAIDCVAGVDLGRLLTTMNRGGRWIVIATLGGDWSKLNMTDFFKRGIKLTGSTLRSRTTAMKSDILKKMEKELWPKFTLGDLRVIIHRELPIQNVDEAHYILMRNENIGKVVLKVE